jgi:hypothetical protein
MLLSVQDNLVEIKKYFEALGYDVHNLSENVPSDAYIYSEKSLKLANLNNSISPPENGSLLINADNTSIESIVYTLRHRAYSSIF